jgi:hypothetical protein
MPVARIITNSVDGSLELSMQLRARGFQVETVAPDQIPNEPVDLEVRLEECFPEDVLNKAGQGKGAEDLWVFVAPGALDESARPIRVIPLVPQVIEGPAPTGAVTRALRKAPVELPLLEPEDDPILSELAQSQAHALQVDPQSQIHVAGQNHGGAEPEVVMAAVVPTPLAAPLPTTSGPLTVAERPQAKVIALPKHPDIPHVPDLPWIPEVPERVEPMNLASATTPTVAVRKVPYEIAVRTGPKFWRTASVTAALVVLTGLLIAIVRLQPQLPAEGLQPGTVTVQPAWLPAPQSVSAVPAWNQPLARSASQPVAARAKKAVRPPRPNSARAGGVVESARKPQPRHHPVTLRDDGIIAEDTVVFYDRRTSVPAVKGPAQAGVKRYSDAN